MIVVTGAAGFVGRRLCSALTAAGAPVRAISRTCGDGLTPIGDMTAQTDWSAHLDGARAVIHLAARVHMLGDVAADPLAEFRRINVAATLNLARQAARAGVRRFVFVSSIKVNGEQTIAGRPFRADDRPNPEDPYGVSKREAEDGLRAVAEATGLEVTIVRPPLVYGPGVRANFASMMRWLDRGVPLPFGAVRDNRRSLIALDNLADLLTLCTDHPAAANQTFVACDGEDLSTAALLHRLGAALGRPARLVPVPVGALRIAARLLGKQDLTQRLLGSLQIDAAKTREVLGWVPRVTVDEALIATAQAFAANKRG